MANSDIVGPSSFTFSLTLNGNVELSGSAVATGGSSSGGGSEGDDSTSTPNLSPTSLDDVAVGTLTYRDIFITNNLAPDINNNSMVSANKKVTYTDSAGSTSIVEDTSSTNNFVGPYTLKVSGTSSQQAKSSTAYPQDTIMFLAANVKVTDWSKGYCGMIFGSQFGGCANAVTTGSDYVTLGFVGSNDGTSAATSQLFIGSASSANLTGYINNPVCIQMSIFTNGTPTQTQMLDMYKAYNALLNAQ